MTATPAPAAPPAGGGVAQATSKEITVKTLNGHQIRQYREAAGLKHSELLAFLDSNGFTGWNVQSLYALEFSGRKLDELASAEFFRAFEEACAAGNGAGELTLPAVDPGTWAAVRQTPAFAVALDIARQERQSKIKLDVARQVAAEKYSDLADEEDAAEHFVTALRFFRNDNNVLWGAARMLAAMVDNDDELGALQVLRDELGRQDAGTTASR